jgi:NADPH2 dehydrogenase
MIAQKFKVGAVTLKNRIVMPPMVSGLATADGFVTPELLEHYHARSGPGLVIVEATAVSPGGKLSPRQLGAYLPQHQEGLARLAKVIQQSGARAIVQIHHAGSHTDSESTGGRELLSPSGISVRQTPARGLEEAEIWQIIDQFTCAVERVLAAGFDGVEIHGAHGYLISQFFSPLTNKRTDSWGGDLEGRTRFLKEILSRVREVMGPDKILAMRLGLEDWQEGGLTLEEGIKIGQLALEWSVELLDISFGLAGPWPKAPDEFSSLLHLSKKAKDAKLGPTVGVGEIRRPTEARLVLERGMADLVAVGRGLLADPAWARKALGQEGEPVKICRLCPTCRVREGKCPAQQS